MSPPASLSRALHPPAGRPAFSLVEVILSLGILAVSIVAIIGLIGPTLNAVKQAQDLNGGTACISKMNALLDAAQFYDAGVPAESAYAWVRDSIDGSPTVFIFFDELNGPNQPAGWPAGTPFQFVARFNQNNSEVNEPNPVANGAQIVMVDLNDFVTAANQFRISGSVIAVTVSLSPLAQNFPPQDTGQGQENTWYTAPQLSLFPSNTLPSNPNTANGINGVQYAEGYLPILVQVFAIPLDHVEPGMSAPAYGKVLVQDLNASNRLFTYTTAKLR
jgi:hypothetical protein